MTRIIRNIFNDELAQTKIEKNLTVKHVDPCTENEDKAPYRYAPIFKA